MVMALGLGFVGCGEEEKAYTEEYFKNNKEALEKQLEFCKTAEKLSAVEQQNCMIAKSIKNKNNMRKWN